MITEIDMVNSYNLYKVESLKAKRDTLQSSDPAHPCKKGSITTIASPKHSCLNRKSNVARSYCTYNSSTDTNAFF